MLWTRRARCAPSSRHQRPCRQAVHYRSAMPQTSVLLLARTTVHPASCHPRTTALWSCEAARPAPSRPVEIYVWLFAPLLPLSLTVRYLARMSENIDPEAIYRYAREQSTF